MANNETLIPIPGRLHSVATEGHVAGADEIIDDTLQKDQATINQEVSEALGEGGTVDEKIAAAIEDVAYIDNTESSSAVVPSFDPESQTVHITAQTLSEQQKAQVRDNIGLGDVQASVNAETSRAQTAENTLNQKLSLLNGSEIIVVEDHTQVSSPNSQKIYREQGESSYTDWMYQNNEWKEIATYNHGVDDVPTAGSDNLVKSGSIATEIINLYTLLKPTTVIIKGDSSVENKINTADCTAITLLIKNTSDNSGYFRIALYDANANLINGSDILIGSGESYNTNVNTSEIAYIIITSINSRTGELTITKNTNAIDNINELDKRTTDNKNDIILNKNILIDIEIPTDKYGYINTDGTIAVQLSGNNHRTDYFPVEQGTVIEYSGYYQYAGFAAVYGYDENKQPIAELLATGDWTNQIVKIDDASINYVMAWGDVSSHNLSVKILPKYNAKKLNTIEIVDANGSGDYLTLEEAIWNNISDKGDVTKHRTIIVMPGVYTMNTYYGSDAYFWKVIEGRNLSIIGTDRNACILKNTKGKYVAGSNRIDDACLKLSGNVLIKNLTLLASHEDFDGTEGTHPGAYCIHLDSGGADCNLEIDNCIMVDKQQACIGIGTADNYTIQIRNCSLTTNVDNPSSFTSWSGAIICHNNDYSNAATLRLENNVMKSNTPNTFTVSHVGSYTSQIKLEAYRNIIGGNVNIDSGIVVLDELNFGNNKSELNYQS